MEDQLQHHLSWAKSVSILLLSTRKAIKLLKLHYVPTYTPVEHSQSVGQVEMWGSGFDLVIHFYLMLSKLLPMGRIVPCLRNTLNVCHSGLPKLRRQIMI